MERLFRTPPEKERYAFPPRELVAVAARPRSKRPRGDPETSSAGQAVAAHFAFGAGTGSLFALQRRRSAAAGITYALGIWTASYLGWVPAAGLLRPASSHPQRRNALMLGVHVVWGTALAAALRGIEEAAAHSFSARGRMLEDERRGGTPKDRAG